MEGPVSDLLKKARAPEPAVTEKTTTPATTTAVLDRTPPAIIEFEWKPTRILGGKVYDAQLSFLVRDDQSAIAEASAVLLENPGSLPTGSYPKEASRNVELTSSLQTNANRTLRFSGQATDLQGGKRYYASVTARDSSGNKAESQFETPYVREFESLSTDGLLLGAFYYPWWGPGEAHWDEGYKGTPLLGRYFSGDEFVISKHIDWATGFGIDFLVVSWWGPSWTPDGWIDSNLKEKMLRNDLTGDIRLAVLYESLGRLQVTYENVDGRREPTVDFDNSENVRILLDDFDYLAENYFTSPSYLRIDGAPVVYLYLTRVYVGDVGEALRLLRSHINEKGFDIYIIADQVYWQDPSSAHERLRIKLYDAVSAYNMYTAIPDWLPTLEARLDRKYGEWFREAKRSGVHFIPDVIPGYDDTAVDPTARNPILPKSADRLGRQSEIAKKYIDDKLRMVLVTSFNEWHENTYLEPSTEDGFKYLEVLRDSFAGQ